MRNPLSETIVQIEPSGIRKFFDLAADMPHCISLGVGEPDFKTPWSVRDAGIRSLELGRTKYTANSGLKELRGEICNYLQRRFDLHYKEENILVTVGGSEAIDLTIRAVVQPGDEVIIPEPCFVCYEPITQLTGGVPVHIATRAEDQFRLTADQLRAAITPRTKLLIFPYPNNPTGAVMSAAEMEEIAAVLRETNVLVLSDEIYSELTYGLDRHVSIASLPGMAERTIVVNGFSKSYAMTGWRLGYAAGPAPLVKVMTKIHQSCIMSAPTTSQYAAITALRQCDDQIEMMRDEYNRRRRYVVKALKSKVGDYISNGSIPSGVYPINGSTTNVGTVPTSIGNSNLKWETTEQWNVGLDLSFFKERLNFTADIYRKTTRDLLLEASLPLTSGFYSATKNIGKVRNDGLELSLNTVNIQTKDFTWSTDFNIAFNKNEVLALSEGQNSLLTAASFDQNYNSQPSYIAQVGLPMGMMYGYIYEGTYKYDDFNKSGDTYTLKKGVPYYSTETNTQPGMPKYKDVNGDGIIDSNDRTIIGRGLPIHTGGFTNNFTYKGFDLSVFFQWSYGNDIMNANRLFFESSNNKSRELNQYASYANRWTPENPDSDIPAATTSASNRVISSRIVEDGSFLRLKTVTLGYTFPKTLIAKAKLSNARVYIAAQNLWTWTSYSGYDPEVSVRNSALTPGLDFSSYPRAYSISFGVNLGF